MLGVGFSGMSSLVPVVLGSGSLGLKGLRLGRVCKLRSCGCWGIRSGDCAEFGLMPSPEIRNVWIHPHSLILV